MLTCGLYRILRGTEQSIRLDEDFDQCSLKLESEIAGAKEGADGVMLVAEFAGETVGSGEVAGQAGVEVAGKGEDRGELVGQFAGEASSAFEVAAAGQLTGPGDVDVADAVSVPVEVSGEADGADDAVDVVVGEERRIPKVGQRAGSPLTVHGHATPPLAEPGFSLRSRDAGVWTLARARAAWATPSGVSR